MNRVFKLCLASFLVCGTALIAPAQERKIKREQLPPAVEKTVAAESQGATINGFSTEVEKGKRVYEAELTVNGHSKDITMDRRGKILEVEEEVTLESLPAPVQAALRRAAGSGTIVKIESLTRNGKVVAYEADIKQGKREREIEVGPNGKRLKRPE